ncbi:MAG TPA: N,N-dimethylformamidase beta subunit family domain-containing protein [Ktedonobacteraceae bacterium]|nr:N,N-dimethylformamidase beta subunit family domain-containing protein [Ktedonobacteraceae bacterium]
MSRNDIVFFAFVAVLVTALLLGLLLPFPNIRYVGQAFTSADGTSMSNAIVRENELIGTSAWKIPPGHEASTQIQAYASATSVLSGQVLQFYVSTQEEGTLYAISIYRLGWYEGLGGRLMLAVVNQTGHAQGYYDQDNHLLVACNSCRVDKDTGLVEANWRPSYTLTVPLNWTTGVYLAKFIDANGWQTYAPFDVQSNASSTYVVVTSDTTYAAYNDWGGYSLYNFNSEETCCSPTADVKVSFDRPYEEGNGSGHILAFEADAIHWLERQGYDLSYMSSVDLHENPRQLLRHKAYLSIGHDEYWTKEMRDGVEYARDHGVGLAFLGADAAYWQMRFEPDSAGIKDRTIVCYKVETRRDDLARDPVYGQDNTRVTTEWRDPLLGRPENSLIGIMYSDFENTSPGFPWIVQPSANSPFLKNTGLQAGRQYGCGLVGYEWDRIFDNGATPPGLQVLGTSPTINDAGQADTSNTTYYFAPSGAMVFASGSIYWTSALDSYRESVYKACAQQDPVVPGMQKLMAHIMSELVIHHPSH